LRRIARLAYPIKAAAGHDAAAGFDRDSMNYRTFSRM